MKRWLDPSEAVVVWAVAKSVPDGVTLESDPLWTQPVKGRASYDERGSNPGPLRGLAPAE